LLQIAALTVAQAQQAGPKTISLSGDVKVTYLNISYNKANDTYSFDDGVIIDYEVTRIRADHVEMDAANQHGIASGHVRLDDPIARVRADKLELWWSAEGKRGHIDNAEINIGSSHLKAESVDISPELWVLTAVEITTSLANPPWYELHSPLMTVKPGQSGKLKKPTLYILGHKIVTLPDRSFNLDQRSEGLTYPGLNYSRQYGLGASWGGGFLLNHATDVAFSVGAFPNSRPGYSASISHSLLSDAKPTTLITPPSDFGERFSYGFLDNVAVTTPEGEDRNLRSPRQTVSFDTVWNQTLTDRDTNAAFSKAGEAVYELGGSARGFGYIAQTRLQTINELGGPFTTRLELVENLGAPPIQITPNLRTIARLDSETFLGENNYGWLREFAGLAYIPFKQLRVSGGGYYSEDAGTPAFPIDPLYSKVGFSLRGDLNLGPTKISYMEKYDSTMRWFDREYTVSQVVGCFEPYILYRENPSDYQLGLRLRLDNLTDLLTQRNFKRGPTVTNVISPGPDGKP